MSTLKNYIFGYALSIALTLMAFVLIEEHIRTGHTFPSHTGLIIGFVLLALVQLLVQLFLFLHVGRGQNKHWNAVVLGFALFIVSVLVGGTLWIMGNLQHNMVNSPFLNNQINVTQEDD